MGDGSRGAVWFGASGFELLSVHDDEDMGWCSRSRRLWAWSAARGVGRVGGRRIGGG